MSQAARILAYLQTGNPITPIEALEQFGCFRLAARIADLRDLGYDIETVNCEANGKHFAAYRLRSGQMRLVA